MSWANGNKLINGHDDGTIDPEGTAVRAQAASILTNFIRPLSLHNNCERTFGGFSHPTKGHGTLTAGHVLFLFHIPRRGTPGTNLGTAGTPSRAVPVARMVTPFCGRAPPPPAPSPAPERNRPAASTVPWWRKPGFAPGPALRAGPLSQRQRSLLPAGWEALAPWPRLLPRWRLAPLRRKHFPPHWGYPPPRGAFRLTGRVFLRGGGGAVRGCLAWGLLGPSPLGSSGGLPMSSWP